VAGAERINGDLFAIKITDIIETVDLDLANEHLVLVVSAAQHRLEKLLFDTHAVAAVFGGEHQEDRQVSLLALPGKAEKIIHLLYYHILGAIRGDRAAKSK